MGNESIKKKPKKLFIEPLEQRIMLDGAGASTFLDLIDERNQQQITINSSNKDIYKEGDNSNKDIPFTNIARDKIRNDKKNIVFIDSAVEDYETITNSFKENTEFYLINANEDGFKRISEILTDRENIDALNAVVKVDIAKEDYSDKVEKILIDYRNKFLYHKQFALPLLLLAKS